MRKIVIYKISSKATNRRLCATMLLFFISLIGFSQPYLGTPTTLTLARGHFRSDSGLVVSYNFTDTNSANLGIIKTIPNIIIVAGDTIYKRSSDLTAWRQIGGGGGGGNTIYTGDGSLLSNRYIGLGAFSLKIGTGGSSQYFKVDGTNNTINIFSNGDSSLATQESFLIANNNSIQIGWQNAGGTEFALSNANDLSQYVIQSTKDIYLQGGNNPTEIHLDDVAQTITHTALTHTFNGTVDLSDIVHSGNINYTATAHLFTGTMTLLGLAGNGVGIASVGNDGSLGWSSGNANLLVDSIGAVGQAIVVPRGDTLYHRLFRAGLYTTVDTASTGEVRSNIDTSASGLHTLITLYGSPTAAAVGASPNANGVTISGGTLTLQPASASFPGVMTTGTQPIAGQKTFSSAFFPTGGLFSNTTAITSNLAVNGGGSGTASTNASLAIQGDGTVGDRVIMTGSTAYTMTGAHPYSSFILGNETAAEFSSGVHPSFSRIAILPLVVNNGAATTTDATTAYIGGPPTGTAVITNIVSSLWVDAGMSRFDGGLQLAYIAKTANYTATSEDYTIDFTTNTDTLTLPTAVGRTGEVYTIKVTANTTGRVVTTSSQTIDGATSYNLTAQYKFVTVQSNGANWIVIANNNLMLIVLLILIPTMLFRRKEFEMRT